MGSLEERAGLAMGEEAAPVAEGRMVGGFSLGGEVTFPAGGGGMERRSVMTRLRESRVVSLGERPLPVLAFEVRLLLLEEVLVAGDLVRRLPACWLVLDPPDDEGGVGCFVPAGAFEVRLFSPPPPPRLFCVVDLRRLTPGPPSLVVVEEGAEAGAVSSFLT